MIKFVIIGEQCLDIFIYGKCKRLSPEAPVPVFLPTNTVSSQGMAANVVNNVGAIAHTMYQKTGKMFDVFYKLSVNENIKTRYVDEKTNHYFIRVDEGDETHNSIKFTKSDLKKIAFADIILVSDYNKGFLTENDIVTINNYRNQENSYLLMDSKRLITNKLLRTVDFFKMNESEYQANVNNLGIRVMKKKEAKIIITKGEKGATYKKTDYIGNSHRSSDVSGAGDTFFAALGVSLGYGENLKESIVNANNFASEVVLKRGVSTI